MTYLLKDPGARLDYSVDWGSDYLAGDELLSSVWSVEPVESGGVEIETSAADSLIATVSVGGGIVGRRYRLTNSVETLSGRSDRRSIVLRVEQR